MQLGLGTLIALIFSAVVYAQGSVNWSILPNARTGAPNEELTFLATISNARDVTMTCQPRFGGFFTRPGGVSGRAQFFTYDGTTLGDTANGFVDIPANSSQNYVVVLTVDRAYRGNVLIPIRCTDPDGNINDLRRIPLVNDFQVVIEAGNPPDIVMIGDTLSNDGVARVGSTGPRAALMTMAAVNIGGPAANFIVVPEVTGFSTLQAGYRPTICETDAAGQCLAAEDTFVRIADWPTDEVRLFAVRLRVPPQLGVPSYPDHLRLRVRAGPESDTTAGLDRPAARDPLLQLVDAMFGGGSVSLNAELGDDPPLDPLDVFVFERRPVQQCLTQPDGDVGGDWARSGGILAITPTDVPDGNFTADGFLEFSDLQFGQDIVRTIPVNLVAPAAGGAGTITLFGGGAGSPVQTDTQYTVTVGAPLGDGGLVIVWDAQPGGLLDFRVGGRARCAPAPENAAVADQSAERIADAFAGTMSVAPQVAGFASLTLAQGIASNGSQQPILTGFSLHRPPIQNLSEVQISRIYDASMSVFRIADQAGYGGVVAPTRWQVLDNNPAISCGILSYTGTAQTSSENSANDDGGVSLIKDEDQPELDDGDCVL